MLRPLKITLSALLCLSLCGISLAQKTPSRNVAEDLALVHIDAIGGRERIAAITSLRAEGDTWIAGGRLPFVMWAKRPNLVRVESTAGPVRIVQGYDGSHAPWMQVDGKAPEPQASPDAASFIRNAEFDDPFYDPKGRGIALRYEGEVQTGGLSLQKIRADTPGGVTWLYLDEAYMLVRSDTRRTIGGQTVVESTYYSDFRPVAGVRMPHQIEVRVGNNVLHRTKLEHIDANPIWLPDFSGAP